MPSVSHYYQGSDPKQWRTGVPHFGRLRFRSVYPGIDLVYYGKEGTLEYDFEVAPGADPRRIGLAFEGARSVMQTAEGDLRLPAGHHSLVQKKPVAYQLVNGRRVPVTAAYRLRGNSATLKLGRYDRSLPLVIDPQIVFSVSVPSPEVPVAVDSQGAVCTIRTPVLGFAVSKHSAQGALVYLVEIGSGLTWFREIAVDASGIAHLIGSTQEANFPLVSAFRTQFSGDSGLDPPFPARIDRLFLVRNSDRTRSETSCERLG